ncbi:hypothetical protein TCA2_3985 [Paenibacillus sp. TCA20]|uniref:Uncharacterized protein n=1 Tax=Paenibacillus urinalis TaxID=521520 RepID=A0AAX3N0I3_9BACL|nr:MULTISPECIES: hypothetical protein [Paenibacillus]WDH82674.1 hypothetical protein PUW23_25070 [Paenibacillus urinalis]GAK41494.1 hypothetical protein TCA2_3985 [Paenibacillus sp. TCA20]
MKWLKWTGQLLLTVILVSTLTLLTTGLIVQSYISSLLASFNITWEGAPNNLAAVFQGALGMNQTANTSESAESNSETASGSNMNSDQSMNGTGDEADSGANANDETSQTGETDPSQDDPNNPESNNEEGVSSEADSEASDGGESTGGPSGSSVDSSSETPSSSTTEEGAEAGTTEADDQIVITPEDITDQKDSISTEDKTAVFELLMNKIPADEMQKISSTMEGGLTETELQDMEQVIAKYLTEEEYNELMAVLTP